MRVRLNFYEDRLKTEFSVIGTRHVGVRLKSYKYRLETEISVIGTRHVRVRLRRSDAAPPGGRGGPHQLRRLPSPEV